MVSGSAIDPAIGIYPDVNGGIRVTFLTKTSMWRSPRAGRGGWASLVWLGPPRRFSELDGQGSPRSCRCGCVGMSVGC